MADADKIAFRFEGSDLVREVKGRYAWTLAQLVAAGERGVTPIERPAPRWSHYVFWLRTESWPDPGKVEYFDIAGPRGIKFDRIECVDLDGDGDLDVLTTDERDSLGVIWYENPTR